MQYNRGGPPPAEPLSEPDGLPREYGPVADVGTLAAVLTDRSDDGGVVAPTRGRPA